MSNSVFGVLGVEEHLLEGVVWLEPYKVLLEGTDKGAEEGIGAADELGGERIEVGDDDEDEFVWKGCEWHFGGREALGDAVMRMWAIEGH